MPTSLVSNFIGGSYTPRSTNIADDLTVNLFMETTRQPGSAKERSLIGTPGLLKNTSLSVVAASGCRGFFRIDPNPYLGSERQLYVVAGNVYSAAFGGASALVGAVQDDGQPVTFAENAAMNQIAICSGGKLYIYTITPEALSSAVSLPFATYAEPVGIMDGYFLLMQVNTATIWFSNLNNGLLWDALDFFTRSHTSDPLVAFVVFGGRIWTFGEKNIELYYDSGNADNPFTPYPGSILAYGLLSLWAIQIVGSEIVWLGNSQDATMAVFAVSLGSAPRRISNLAIELSMQQASLTADVTLTESLAYQMNGHAFVNFTIPRVAPLSAGEALCLCVDLSEPDLPWHQRASTSALTRWRARGSCVASSLAHINPNTVFVGDFANGNIYQLDLDTYTDNGAAIRRRRRAPYLSASNQWLFIDSAELGIESGVGNADDPDPQITMEVSRDSGNSYGSALSVSMGTAGAVNQRVTWNRLGRARADRLVLQVSSSAKVKQVWTPGLWLRVTPGSGQL